MNNEIRLILESLSWLMKNTANIDGLEYREREELQGRIDEVLNPEEKEYAEKTEHIFGESADSTKGETQGGKE